MTDTLCPRLWSSAFIDKNGDVYGCCHFKPGISGNINKSSLKEIWNNKQMQEYRTKSLSGELQCFKNCTLLKNNPPITIKNRNVKVDYSNLNHLVVLSGHACNLRCIMCDQDHDNTTILDFDTLRKNIDFSPIKQVDILGGEPFAIPSAIRLFDFLCLKGINTTFITNGTIMDNNLAEKIALHCPTLIVSLNAATKKTHEKINKGSKWERVLENIKKVDFYRKKYKTGLVLHGHMTLTVHNLHEIPLFIKRYKKFGFDTIDFGFDKKTVPHFIKKYPSFKNRLKNMIKESLKYENSANIISYRLKVLGLI